MFLLMTKASPPKCSQDAKGSCTPVDAGSGVINTLKWVGAPAGQ